MALAESTAVSRPTRPGPDITTSPNQAPQAGHPPASSAPRREPDTRPIFNPTPQIPRPLRRPEPPRTTRPSWAWTPLPLPPNSVHRRRQAQGPVPPAPAPPAPRVPPSSEVASASSGSGGGSGGGSSRGWTPRSLPANSVYRPRQGMSPPAAIGLVGGLETGTGTGMVYRLSEFRPSFQGLESLPLPLPPGGLRR